MRGYCVKRRDANGEWLAGNINMAVPYVYLTAEDAQKIVDYIAPNESPGTVVAVEYEPVRQLNPTDPGEPIREALPAGGTAEGA